MSAEVLGPLSFFFSSSAQNLPVASTWVTLTLLSQSTPYGVAARPGPTSGQADPNPHFSKQQTKQPFAFKRGSE